MLLGPNGTGNTYFLEVALTTTPMRPGIAVTHRSGGLKPATQARRPMSQGCAGIRALEQM